LILAAGGRALLGLEEAVSQKIGGHSLSRDSAWRNRSSSAAGAWRG
jgi:hypothetical protein